ncbi:MAG: glycosyltransferase family 39 protein [Candidatus Eisenbacteria bacterium]|nr:glycosyltransferase family 39 protein [Candidatus Eisenbacteria bacterium]
MSSAPTEARGSYLIRAWRSPFALSFFVALLTRVAYLFEIRGSILLRAPVGDAHTYLEWAARLAGGAWAGEGIFYQAPLYPYLLGVLRTLFGEDLFAVRLVQAVIGAIGVGCTAAAGGHFFGRAAGIASGVLFALYPPAVFYDGLIQKTVLDVALMGVLLVTLARVDERPSSLRVIASGAALGGLVLSRENALILLGVIPVWMAWRAVRHQRPDLTLHTRKGTSLVPRPARLDESPWGRPALFLLGFLLLTAPVALRNLAVGGELVLTTSQFGPNFWIGNNPDADGRYRPLQPGRGDARFEREDARALAEAALSRALSPTQVSAYWTRQTLRFITEQPGDWIIQMDRKIGLALNRGEVCDTDAIEAYADHSAFLRLFGSLWNFGLLAPLAAAGLALGWHARRERVLLHAMLVALFGSLVLFFIAGRYRAPLVPLLMLFAGAAVMQIPARTRALRGDLRRIPHRAWVALGLAIGIAVTAYPPFPHHQAQRGLNYYSVGSALLEAGRNPEAEQALATSLEVHPEQAPAHRKLGIALYRQRKIEQALPHFDAAVQYRPDQAENWIARALLREERGDLAGARSDFEEAARLEPGNGEAEAGRMRLRRAAP